MNDPKKIAEIISTGIINQGFAVVDDLLKQEEVNLILSRFEELMKEDEFEKAGIGKLLHFRVDNQVRGDFIRWINTNDTKAPTVYLYKYIQELVTKLNQTCYLGIKDLESHYAFYPSGKGYLIHRDRFKLHSHRIVSFVYYLNENWQPGDGGELVLYNENEMEMKTVEPKANRLAVFLSETLHEVKNCNIERRSITGWLLDIPAKLTFLD